MRSNLTIDNSVIDVVDDIINRLSPRDQLIVESRWGIHGVEFKTLKELSRDSNITGARCGQIEGLARRCLKHIVSYHCKINKSNCLIKEN